MKNLWEKVLRLRLPGLPLAIALDGGEALRAGLMFHTNLQVIHTRGRKVIERRDLGSGVLTIKLVNDIVAAAVAGSATVPVLTTYQYHDVGTGITPATDGDLALQTAAGLTRVTPGNPTSAQTATTSNHAAILQSSAAFNFTGTFAITEWGLFNASSVGNMADHRVFAALNVIAGDTLTFPWRLAVGSNG